MFGVQWILLKDCFLSSFCMEELVWEAIAKYLEYGSSLSSVAFLGGFTSYIPFFSLLVKPPFSYCKVKCIFIFLEENNVKYIFFHPILELHFVASYKY